MWLDLLLFFIPTSLALHYAFHVSPMAVFLTGILAIVPLAEWIRRATEQLSKLAGSAIGGLLNVTFGNAAELILALFVLSTGATEVVKGQITGAIIGNGLLGLGLAVVIGTWGRENLTFQRVQAGQLSSLLFLVVIAMLVPALYNYAERSLFKAQHVGELNEKLSLSVSVILIAVYATNLLYTLVTHRDVFSTGAQTGTATWSWWRGIAVLLAATAGTAWESEVVSDALNETAQQLNLTPLFLGIIALALVGNIAEYISAIYFARQQQMGLALSITLGSTIQIGLLVAPLLVLVSYFMGHPMDLVFRNPLELIAIAAVAFVVNAIAHDGEVTWFEGVLLLAVYAILGLAFFFATP